MYILAIETTGAFASVALLQAGEGAALDAAKNADAAKAGDTPRILGAIHGNDRFSHLQNLTPQIDQILQESELSIGDVTAVAVSHGPGSFTGIRIGVSTARALAQILHIPCIPVSSLEALALRAYPTDSDNRVLVCPVLDARRKQVYGAAYEIIDGQPVCRIAPASCLMTEFLEKLDRCIDAEAEQSRDAAPGVSVPSGFKKILFLGDGIDTCGDIIRAWDESRAGAAAAEVACIPEELRYQDAAMVALRGLQLYRNGGSWDYLQLQPEYLRMAEAEKKLKDKQAAEKAGHQS